VVQLDKEARADPSPRKKRLFGMTIKLDDYIQAFFAPAQPLPAIRKVPSERSSRSCGMTLGLMLDFKFSY